MIDHNTWLNSHTFHYSKFSDLPKLIREKEKQKLKISVCIPTLNEEKTIGKEVVIFRSELMQRHPLVDELAVIDSGSTDKTVEIAASFGADVYSASEIIPSLGERRGKGENLWKAVYQLSGDIIVYIDADIRNVHPRFIYGLVAPLIYNPKIQYVKAFYERPLSDSGVTRPSGGGRVTEILIRPLLSLFFPDLTAIIQPLSGEYAVRRGVLEEIPFPIGYGVETSHLLDVYIKHGMEAFAQTDLEQRIHRNQDTKSLGRMAFSILQVFLQRAETLGVVSVQQKISQVLHQFNRSEDGHRLQDNTIIPEERPAMNTIEEYRKKWHHQKE